MPDRADPAVIGVDLGGTKVAAARVVGPETRDLRQSRTDLGGPTALLDGLEATVREVIDRSSEPDAIGIGVPSQVDFDSGTVVASVNIPLEGVSLAADLEERLGVRVYVDNDANCAALAEAQFAGDGPAQHLVMLTLGTGVGGGVVIDGRIFRGASGLGAELGHMTIQADGPECPGACPNRGCLEAYCSGTALERDASELAAERPRSRLGQLAAGSGGRVGGRDVVEAAEDGDPDARRLLATLGRWLGVGIASFVNVFEPSHLVIGGGLSAAADLFLPAAEEEAAARALPALFERVQVSAARAGNEAGVIGAGLLAAQELGLSGDTSGPRPRQEVR
ncbi:MAG: ROK family protein [Actinobacteria bacterium]|nr:ROK family protein [Actinomycetota bacterium]